MIRIYQHATPVTTIDVRLRDLMDALDELHTAASDGTLDQTTPLNEAELLGWLREVVYTAQETINEIEQRSHCAPILRLLDTPVLKQAT